MIRVNVVLQTPTGYHISVHINQSNLNSTKLIELSHALQFEEFT